MRTSLQPLEGIRMTYIATFTRREIFRTKWGWQSKVLLKNIRNSQNNLMADHVSVKDPESLQQMAWLKDGDFIQFSAEVRSYPKGYRGNDINLRLKHPESVDYMLHDVRDVVKQNLDARTKKIPRVLGFEELMKNKRVVLGVA